MNKDDGFLVKKSEKKVKNSKKQKIEDLELAEILSGIRSLLNSYKKSRDM